MDSPTSIMVGAAKMMTLANGKYLILVHQLRATVSMCKLFTATGPFAQTFLLHLPT